MEELKVIGVFTLIIIGCFWYCIKTEEEYVMCRFCEHKKTRENGRDYCERTNHSTRWTGGSKKCWYEPKHVMADSMDDGSEDGQE